MVLTMAQPNDDILDGCTSGDINATFNYALPNPLGESLRHVEHPETLKVDINYILDSRNVLVRNLRGRQADFSLDVNGFEYMDHHTSESFLDIDSIKTNYYEEVRQLLKKRTGCKHVHVVGHKLRTSHGADTASDADLSPEKVPLRSVHADRTPGLVASEVRKHFGDDADRLLQDRVRFITVWRPIDHAVHHEPLAVADWRTSSDESNLLPLRTYYDYPAPAVFLSRFSRKHTWYYLEHQTPSEVLLFTGYDNRTDGGAGFCLHSAFLTPGCHQNAPRRRSIEVKLLVLG